MPRLLDDPTRRALLRAAGLVAAPAGLSVLPAQAAEVYPGRAIRAIIPWPAGGPTDVVSRVLMSRLSSRLGQSIVIENRPGGNGIIGLAAAANAPADGYSLLIADVGSSTMLPALRQDLPYDTLRDFEPVSLMVSAAIVLFVHEDVPVRSLSELIAYAKAHPDKLNYGSVGQGSSFHLATELLKSRADIRMTHVPYKGGPPLIVDFMSGRIEVSFLSISSVPQVMKQSSKLRPLAVSTRKRSPVLPDVPAIAETIPGFDVATWFGLLAPARTSRAVVDKLQQELAAVLKMPDIVEQMHGFGQEPEGSTPEQYAERLKRDLALWAEVVRSANIKAAE